MSELIITHAAGIDLRWKFLATASAIVLTAYLSPAKASDTDRPTVWIGGGWHFESLTGSNDVIVPPLDGPSLVDGFASAIDYEKSLAKTYGAEGSISFQPRGSDWIFSVGALYGRSNTRSHPHQELNIPNVHYTKTVFNVPDIQATATQQPDYGDTAFDNGETHTIVDFQVGKDVGVGLFSRHGTSVANLGIRYAQLTATSNMRHYAKAGGGFQSVPHTKYGALKFYYHQAVYHLSDITLQRQGSFHGIGPSLSWESTTPLFGNAEAGEMTLDWGGNAALLFGRQKQKNYRQTNSAYHYFQPTAPVAGHPGLFKQKRKVTTGSDGYSGTRTRSVTVPNAGGFAGISYRFTNAKFSAGYRADFFFGAMDGGIDTHRSITTGFHGPFATFSIGLGG